ncbi:MAG: carboxypeptidase M32 [Minisyncoccia bacterium]
MTKKEISKDLIELRRRLTEMQHLRSALSLSSWDQEVYMPKGASASRAEMLGYLSGEHHRKLLILDQGNLLSNLHAAEEAGRLSPKVRALVREVWRDYALARKLPHTFVVEFADITSRAQHVWAEARQRNDFAHFRPWLEKIVRLSREKASLLGGVHSYDALIDTFEPGMTSAELSRTFDDLKTGLIPLVTRIASNGAKKPKAPKGIFPIAEQKKILEYINLKMGFDYARGRLDESTHPFTSGSHPSDVRITTRYREKDLWYSIGSDIHELGHGLYEQGLPLHEAGTPLGEAVSLGVHESQSRFWENMVGRNIATWRFLFPLLKKHFPALKDYSVDEWYRFLHIVRPSLIRTEADEVTYNLHIILRYEMEKDLIEGRLAVKDLPSIWNSKVREYLGLTVPDDARGVLQDVHWSGGMLGYFPTYTLGNLYSAQLYEKIRNDMPDFERKLSKGDFIPIRDWLGEKIHRHGRMYSASDLMHRATGSRLSVAPFLSYLEDKYTDIYEL